MPLSRMLEPWKQRGSICTADRFSCLRVQLSLAKLFHPVRNGEVREITAEKQVSNWNNLPKQIDGLGCEGLSTFEIYLSELRINSVWKQLRKLFRPNAVISRTSPLRTGWNSFARLNWTRRQEKRAVVQMLPGGFHCFEIR